MYMHQGYYEYLQNAIITITKNAMKTSNFSNTPTVTLNDFHPPMLEHREVDIAIEGSHI